jgi:hypothetical protein
MRRNETKNNSKSPMEGKSEEQTLTSDLLIENALVFTDFQWVTSTWTKVGNLDTCRLHVHL